MIRDIYGMVVKYYNSFILLFILYVIVAISCISTYIVQISEANSYMGMQPWSLSLLGWVYLVAGLIMIAALLKYSKGMPSDFFLIFYSSITIISFLTLNSSSGYLDNLRLSFSLMIILLPVLVILALKQVSFSINFSGILSPKMTDLFLLMVVLVVSVVAILKPPASAGFDILNSYDRRLEVRDLYGAGTLKSYALAMSMNGFNPYLSFRAGLQKNSYLFLLVLGFGILFFWVAGVKAPLLYVLVAYMLGRMTIKNKHINFKIYFPVLILILFLINLLEWLIWDYSFISDFLFRRLFAVTSQLQGYFIDFLVSSETPLWSFLIGSIDSDFSPTFYIGDYYFGNPDTNANTNAFLHAFALKGVVGYFVSVTFVALFFRILDSLYSHSNNHSFVFIGFIYGLLVVEQAFTTAMVSSGIGVLFVLAVLEKPVLFTRSSSSARLPGKTITT